MGKVLAAGSTDSCVSVLLSGEMDDEGLFSQVCNPEERLDF